MAIYPEQSGAQRWIYRRRVPIQIVCGLVVVLALASAVVELWTGEGSKALVSLGIASGFGTGIISARSQRPPTGSDA